MKLEEVRQLEVVYYHFLMVVASMSRIFRVVQYYIIYFIEYVNIIILRRN
jgi:hypothetical protein